MATSRVMWVMLINDREALAWLVLWLEAPGAASTYSYRGALLWWSPSSDTKEVLHPFPHVASMCRSLLSQTSVSCCTNSAEVQVLLYSDMAELRCCTSAGFHGELIPESLI